MDQSEITLQSAAGYALQTEFWASTRKDTSQSCATSEFVAELSNLIKIAKNGRTLPKYVNATNCQIEQLPPLLIVF